MNERSAAAGLQRERTALAWDRTTLATFVAGAVVLREPGLQSIPVQLLGAGLVVAMIVAGIARRRLRLLTADAATLRSHAAVLGVVAAGATALGVVGLVAVLD